VDATALRLQRPLLDVDGQTLRVGDAISARDTMWPRDCEPEVAEQHYLASAASALRCIQLAASRVELHPRRILDMGCGHGRVLRALRAAYPEAEIAACDVVRDAVDFCAEHFDALPVYSEPDVSRVALPGRFDLIWSGSLVTHLPDWGPVFKALSDALVAGGLMVVSTIGRHAAARLRAGLITYGLSEEAIEDLLARFERAGFAYVDCASCRSEGITGSYGLALGSPAWTCLFLEQFPLRLVGYVERGWHDHLDVVSLQRAAE
jgi:SAM-dependent methyltransferase